MRQLQTRICEHKTDINKKSGLFSVILQHNMKLNHKFEWNEIDILDREPCCKRLISEMLHIKRQRAGFNKQEGTDRLLDTYLSVLQKLPTL